MKLFFFYLIVTLTAALSAAGDSVTLTLNLALEAGESSLPSPAETSPKGRRFLATEEEAPSSSSSLVDLTKNF